MNQFTHGMLVLVNKLITELLYNVIIFNLFLTKMYQTNCNIKEEKKKNKKIIAVYIYNKMYS